MEGRGDNDTTLPMTDGEEQDQGEKKSPRKKQVIFSTTNARHTWVRIIPASIFPPTLTNAPFMFVPAMK
jgi:hypothetical protein